MLQILVSTVALWVLISSPLLGVESKDKTDVYAIPLDTSPQEDRDEMAQLKALEQKRAAKQSPTGATASTAKDKQ